MTPESVDQETERLILRRWRADDFEPFAALVGDPEVMRFISGGRPLDRDTARSISDRSLAIWERMGFGPWAAIERATGNWIGRIGLNELAWWPAHTRSRLGSSFGLKRGVVGLRPRAPPLPYVPVSSRTASTASLASPAATIAPHAGSSKRSGSHAEGSNSLEGESRSPGTPRTGSSGSQRRNRAR
jgi:hypothetical protein